MDYKEELINLVRLNKLVRESQTKYFRSKKTNSYESGSLLQKAKEQEKILDLKISQIEDLLNNKPVQPDLFSEKAKERINKVVSSINVENFLETEQRNKRRADAQKDYIEKRNAVIDGNTNNEQLSTNNL